MKLLITGGCGFIGSNFILHVLENHPEDSVVNLDKLTYAGNPDNLSGLAPGPRYAFIRGDICDPETVTGALRGCDAAINFAAESHVDRSIAEPGLFLQSNFIGVGVLLEACRRLKISRFLQISSDEVYGSVPEGFAAEDSPLRPSSPYSASKAAADLLCLAYRTTYRLPVLITRSTNNYGPRQFPEKLVPLFISNALADRPLPLYGTGENRRDWLFVSDNCRAIDLVLRKGEEGAVYNIGTGKDLSNREVAGALLALLDKPASLLRSVADRPGHDLRYAVSRERIGALGWRPEVAFDEGLRLTVDWYRKK